MHSFAGHDPETLLWSEVLTAQKALSACSPAVGHLNAAREYRVASQIGDAQVRVQPGPGTTPDLVQNLPDEAHMFAV